MKVTASMVRRLVIACFKRVRVLRHEVTAVFVKVRSRLVHAVIRFGMLVGNIRMRRRQVRRKLSVWILSKASRVSTMSQTRILNNSH